MKRAELASLLTYLCLFLLPWQTVWIYDSVIPSLLTSFPGGEGEYWKLTHYAIQLLIVIAVLVRWETKKSEAVKKITKNTWWFFAVMVFVSFFSINPYLSGGFIFHLFFALLLFRLLLDERIEPRKIIWFFSLGLIVPCLLGWWQVLVGSSSASTLFGLAEYLVSIPGTAVVETAGERLMRAYGTFPHPNIFGGYLAAAILMILMRMTGLGRAATRSYGQLQYAAIVRAVILILLSSTLIVTFSRSAWLALAVGIFLFFVANAIYRIKISRKFLFDLAVASVAFVAFVAIFHIAVFTRVNAIDRLEIKSLIERQSEYQMIGEVIKINPFLGVGPGAYTVALVQKFPNHEVWFYQPMHNSFLLFFAETGLLGLVFLIKFLWSIFKITQPRLNALPTFAKATVSPPKPSEGGILFPPSPRLRWVLRSSRRVKEDSARMPFIQTKPRPSPIQAIPLVATLTTFVLSDHYLWSQWAGLALLVVILAIFVRRLD